MVARESNAAISLLTCGVFATAAEAEQAIEDFEKANFPKQHISVTVRQGAGGHAIARRTGAVVHQETDASLRGRMQAMSPELARHFVRAVESGKALVVVQAGTRRMEAEQILRRHRADIGPIAVPRETQTITEPARHEQARIRREVPHAASAPPPLATPGHQPPRAMTPEEEREHRQWEARRPRREAERQRLAAEEAARRRRAA